MPEAEVQTVLDDSARGIRDEAEPAGTLSLRCGVMAAAVRSGKDADDVMACERRDQSFVWANISVTRDGGPRERLIREG